MTNQDNRQQIDRAITQRLDMQQNADNQEHQLLKAHGRNVWFAVAVFILAIILIIVLLFLIRTWFPDNKNLQSLLTAIGTSLAASLVFTGLYTTVVENTRSISEEESKKAQARNLQQVTATIVTEATTALSFQMEQHINKMLEEEATRLVSVWPELLPKDYFPPLNVSNPYFLEQLGKAVARSQQYIFRGATARFVPSLLQKYARDNIRCSILIIAPHAETAIRAYVLNRYNIGPDNSKTLEDYQREVQEEIYMAIVQLFDLRHKFHIEVHMCYDNLFYRSEIVDDGAFVSFYVGERTFYPPTYFYTRTNGGFYYSAFHRDFQQSWDLAREQFHMHVGMTQSDLEDFLLKIGVGDKATLPEKIAEWRSRHV